MSCSLAFIDGPALSGPYETGQIKSALNPYDRAPSTPAGKRPFGLSGSRTRTCADLSPAHNEQVAKPRTNEENLMSKLAGRVAIVTGASKGIGASIAAHLAAESASVVVNYASSKSGADLFVKKIVDTGGNVVAIQGDVSKLEDILRVFGDEEGLREARHSHQSCRCV
jgi:hypothetical protein